MRFLFQFTLIVSLIGGFEFLGMPLRITNEKIGCVYLFSKLDNGITLIAYLICSTAIYSRDGGEAVDSEEWRLRAAFVQQLISSTIF